MSIWILPLLVFGMAPYIIGLFMLYHTLRPQKAPADGSNKINKLVLIWFALTREDKFVDKLPFLKNDLWENFNNAD